MTVLCAGKGICEQPFGPFLRSDKGPTCHARAERDELHRPPSGQASTFFTASPWRTPRRRC